MQLTKELAYKYQELFQGLAGKKVTIPIGDITLENQTNLPGVQLCAQRWGKLNSDKTNLILILHALTGNSQIITTPQFSENETGWWDGLIGLPPAPIDINKWCVLAINALGGCHGSTGPSSINPQTNQPWGGDFPVINIRDQVKAEKKLLDLFNFPYLAAVIGGSMGGARALEWIVSHPSFIKSALILAVGARATADQIGIQTAQIKAITTDPNWHSGFYYPTGTAPLAGLALARWIAHLSYRNELELDERFANNFQTIETSKIETKNPYTIQSYLDYQTKKFINRFDAGSYVTLTQALNNFDIGKNRSGIVNALQNCQVPNIILGISSDRLYPPRLQIQLGNLLPYNQDIQIIDSKYGHDGFLLETKEVAKAIRKLLALIT